MSAIHVANTGLFVAIGQSTNPRYQAVRSFARNHDLTFVIPESVYDELTVHEEHPRSPPIDTAIEEEFVEVAGTLDYTNSLVSNAMDGVRRYIARADDRQEDEIERADTALAGVVAQALDTGQASETYVYTTDILAGEGIEAIFASQGYGDEVTFENAFQLIDDLLN